MNAPVSPEKLLADGWEKVHSVGFVDYTGPFWKRRDGDQIVMGLLVGEHHCNSHMGTVHGGVLMTLADNALGLGVVDVLGAQRCFTVSLQTHFVSAARIGELLTCQPEVVRKTRSLVFVRGLLKVDDRIVANADGIWKVLESD